MNVANSGIADFAGNPLASGASIVWSMRPGDANADRRFDSSDLVAVLRAGEYEDLISKNSTWSEGDWNGDGDFASNDLVVAFQSGGYTEVGPEVSGDFDHDGIVSVTDIDLLSGQLRLPAPSPAFDLTQDNRTDLSDLDELISAFCEHPMATRTLIAYSIPAIWCKYFNGVNTRTRFSATQAGATAIGMRTVTSVRTIWSWHFKMVGI